MATRNINIPQVLAKRGFVAELQRLRKAEEAQRATAPSR